MGTQVLSDVSPTGNRGTVRTTHTDDEWYQHNISEAEPTHTFMTYVNICIPIP